MPNTIIAAATNITLASLKLKKTTLNIKTNHVFTI